MQDSSGIRKINNRNRKCRLQQKSIHRGTKREPNYYCGSIRDNTCTYCKNY